MSERLTLLVALASLSGLFFLGDGASKHKKKKALRRQVPKRLRLSGHGEPRIVLGRVRGRMVAAEAHHSVLVIGPTQSGKTTSLVIPAISNWPGPVLVSSVKDDVLNKTREARATSGPISVVDPSRTTGQVATSWRPYASLTSFRAARLLARDLCAASSATTPSGDGEFWMNAAARYLGPLLLAAARSDAPLERLLSWMDEDDVGEALVILQDAGDLDASNVLLQLFRRDSRQLHSILTTAEVVVEALVDGAGDGPDLDLNQFFSCRGTLYLCASLNDQQRNRALLTALRSEVVTQASHLAQQQGGRLKAPLLVVQDEAAHSAGLDQLSALAATGVGQGITLLTVFQDMGQIAESHGALASSLVLNHRARVMLAGTIDKASVELFVNLSGERREREHSHSHSRQGRSVTEHEVTRPRFERHHLGSLQRGSAVVLYDALAPLSVQLNGAKSKQRAPRAARARPKAQRQARVARRGAGQ